MAAGMDPDEANALVLEALRSGQLLAEGCREQRFDDQPTRGPHGDREQIRRSWWRGFKADELGRTGGFSAANHAVGYHIEAPSPELLDAMVKAGITDRVNDPLTGARYRRTWTAYYAIRVEAEGADYLVEACKRSREPDPVPTGPAIRKGGRVPETVIPDEEHYLGLVDELIGQGMEQRAAARQIAPTALAIGGITIKGRLADSGSAADYEKVVERLRTQWRTVQERRNSEAGEITR